MPCRVPNCARPRVANSAKCAVHTLRCARCNAPIKRGVLCTTCRNIACTAAGCNARRVAPSTRCQAHAATCRGCQIVLAAGSVCPQCKRNECSAAGCFQHRGPRASFCAAHAPCPVDGCQQARVSYRERCLNHLLTCKVCDQPKGIDGLRCYVCTRFHRYGVEDRDLAMRVHDGLANNNLTCDCCNANIASFDDVRADHDHLRGHGHIRGLLCNMCNTTLVEGLQVPASLRNFIAYLKDVNPETIILLHQLTAPE